jgi:hypothetical protein
LVAELEVLTWVGVVLKMAVMELYMMRLVGGYLAQARGEEAVVRLRGKLVLLHE